MAIVDDELLAREGLRDELAALGPVRGRPRVEVVAACADAYAARDALLAVRPDVLFLDVQMPEVDGFGLLEWLAPEDVPPAVVFITAYDAHAIRAFDARALDYLLKPVAPARLRAAVERAAGRVDEARALRDTDAPYLSRVLVRDHSGVTVFPVDELDWVEADTYYVRLHAGARHRLLRERMHVLERQLDPAQFFRTHRSAIVRLARVRAIEAASKYEHTVVLTTGARVPLSRERRAALEALLARR